MVYGSIHALTAQLCTSITPLTGGVFGVACMGSNYAINYVWDKIIDGNDPCTIAAKYAVQYFGSLALGSLATSLVGLPITFKAALILNLWTVGVVVGSAICLTAAIAVVGAAVVAIQAYRNGTTMEDAFDDCTDTAIHWTAGYLGMTDQELIKFFTDRISNAAKWVDNANKWLEAEIKQMEAEAQKNSKA